MNNNKIIKHSDLFTLFAWICFLLQLIALFIYRPSTYEHLDSFILQLVILIGFVFIVPFFLSSRESISVIRYSHMILPLYLILGCQVVDIHLIRLISEMLILLSSIIFFKRNLFYRLPERANLFISSILFGGAIIIDLHMVFYLLIFILMGYAFSRSMLKDMSLFGIGVFITLFIYHGVHFLMGSPLGMLETQSIMGQNFDWNSWHTLIGINLGLLFLNTKQYKTFIPFYQWNAFFLTNIVLWVLITRQPLYLLPVALLCLLTPFTLNAYPRLAIPIYTLAFVAGWLLIFY